MAIQMHLCKTEVWEESSMEQAVTLRNRKVGYMESLISNNW